jgi:hypothetical protein
MPEQEQVVVQAGQQLLNLAYVAHAKWEGQRLYVHLSGGRFTSFDGEEAKAIWQAISVTAIDVMTGEAPTHR